MSSTSRRKSGSFATRSETSMTAVGATNRAAGTEATSRPPRPLTQWFGASKWVPVCSPLRKLFQYHAGPRSSYALISSSSNRAVWPNSGGSWITGVSLLSGAVRSTTATEPSARASVRAVSTEAMGGMEATYADPAAPRWHSLPVSASFGVGTLDPRMPTLAKTDDPRDGARQRRLQRPGAPLPSPDTVESGG